MDKRTLIQTLTEARAEWENLLAQFSEDQMLTPGATGNWTVKDVIAHVTWGEREIAPVLRTRKLVGSELWNLTDDERNEIVYQQQKDRPLQDIIRNERQAYNDLFEAIQTLSDEDLNDPHRFQDMPEQWSPWQLIAGNSFKHYRDHMPALREWLAKQR
ncbi:MAG TPA: DinB family protein [Ktedonobacteraceae bacterium]|nr:DinB family protein [Ktedonobacteraceae bacterium]